MGLLNITLESKSFTGKHEKIGICAGGSWISELHYVLMEQAAHVVKWTEAAENKSELFFFLLFFFLQQNVFKGLVSLKNQRKEKKKILLY